MNFCCFLYFAPDSANIDQSELIPPTQSSRISLSPLSSIDLPVLPDTSRSSSSSPSSTLKRYEGVKKDQATSTDPTFQDQQQFEQVRKFWYPMDLISLSDYYRRFMSQLVRTLSFSIRQCIDIILV